MGRLIAVTVLVLMLLGSGVGGCSSEEEAPASAPVIQPGSPAPDFSLPDLDGQKVSLSSLVGSPVMLNFWASWCGPCRSEMSYLQEVCEDADWREQGLVVLTVNLGDDAATARQFMEENGLSFTVLLDTEHNVAGMYNVSGIPTTYFIDKDGIMRDRKIGAFPSKAEIDWRLLNSILVGE